MSKTTPQIPYPWIDGLSEEAKRQLERDFEHLRLAISDGSPSLFDAIIDPALEESNSGTHEYINLTELLDAEDWEPHYNFIVGVKQRNNPQIVESAGALSITGKGDLSLFGVGGHVIDVNHLGWDFAPVSGSSSQSIFLYNLSFTPTTHSLSVLVGAVQAQAVACVMDVGIGGLGSNNDVMYDCYFQGDYSASSFAGVGVVKRMFNTRVHGSITIGSLVEFSVSGGELGTGGGAITINSGTAVYARINANILGGVIVHGGNQVTINNTGAVGGSVTVDATATAVSIRGPWTGVTFSGVSTTGGRIFNGKFQSMDFTGPGQVIGQQFGGGGDAITLRGAGVKADVHIANGRLAMVGLVDSEVACNFAAPSSYTIDAACFRDVCVFTGTHQSIWGGSINSAPPGNQVRIITESEDSLFTSPTFISQIIGMIPPGMDGDDGPEGPEGPPGMPGTPGAAGSTWLNGHGVPSAGLGSNGDYYLDVDTGNVYFKSGGSW